MSAISNASLAVDIHATESATRLRRTGSLTNGVWSTTVEASTAFTGSIQPARGKDLQFLPEGKRGTAAVRIFTRTELRTADVDVLPDRVQYAGSTYEVEKSEAWSAATGTFYDVIAVRMGG